MIEADESDRSFLKLARDVAVITNIELDHHSTYASLRRARGGVRGVRRARRAARARARTWTWPGQRRPGRHRRGRPARGARGAAARPLALRGRGHARRAARARPPQRAERARGAGGVPRGRRRAVADAAAALADFSGAGRRFEAHGRTRGGGARLRRLRPPPDRGARHARGRPHAAPRAGAWSPASSRTSTRARGMLARDFGRALALADVVVVVDVYPARERAEDFPGVSGLLVAQAAADAAGGRPVWWLPDLDLAQRMLGARAGRGRPARDARRRRRGSRRDRG